MGVLPRGPSPLYSRPYSAMAAEKLSDRLEITELSDTEDADNFGHSPSRNPSRAPILGSSLGPQPYKSNQNHNGHNIFDIPSGLYENIHHHHLPSAKLALSKNQAFLKV